MPGDATPFHKRRQDYKNRAIDEKDAATDNPEGGWETITHSVRNHIQVAEIGSGETNGVVITERDDCIKPDIFG